MLLCCYFALVWDGNVVSILWLEPFSMGLHLSAYKCYLEDVSTLMTFYPFLKAKPSSCTWEDLFIIKEGWCRQSHNPTRNTGTAVFTWALFCQVSESQLEEAETEWTIFMWPSVNPPPRNAFSCSSFLMEKERNVPNNFCMNLLIIFILRTILLWYYFGMNKLRPREFW